MNINKSTAIFVRENGSLIDYNSIYNLSMPELIDYLWIDRLNSKSEEVIYKYLYRSSDGFNGNSVKYLLFQMEISVELKEREGFINSTLKKLYLCIKDILNAPDSYDYNYKPIVKRLHAKDLNEIRIAVNAYKEVSNIDKVKAFNILHSIYTKYIDLKFDSKALSTLDEFSKELQGYELVEYDRLFVLNELFDLYENEAEPYNRLVSNALVGGASKCDLLIEKQVNSLPEELTTDEAKVLFDRAIDLGFMKEDYSFNGNKYQMAYFAEIASERLKLTHKWKPFEKLWQTKNLAQTKREVNERFGKVRRQDDIDKIFN